jgi:hypothetical protein
MAAFSYRRHLTGAEPVIDGGYIAQ